MYNTYKKGEAVMRTRKMDKFFSIVLALALALLFSGIDLVANCFDIQNSEAQVYAASKDYDVENHSFLKINVYRDCSIDLNDYIDFNKKGYRYACVIELNGHTVTFEDSFSTWSGFDLDFRNGTIVFNNNDVLCKCYGGLELNNVTFNANCKRLFDVYTEVNEAIDTLISVNNCTFIDCTFNGDGAFYFSEEKECPVSFENNHFYNCVNRSGSMIYVGDLWSSTRSETHHAQFNMSGNKFYNCSVTYGAIWINAAYVDIGTLNKNATLNSIDSCVASGYAGAIYVGDYHGYGIIKGFVCTNNKSNRAYGGAIYIAGDGEVIDDCYFIDNSAPDGYGGAIYIEEDYVTIKNSMFAGNSAYKGGAVYNRGKTNVFSDCCFCKDRASYGWANEIYYPRNVTNCHFYSDARDRVFDDDWNDYYDKSNYVALGCTYNTYGFLSFSGQGNAGDPYKISDEKSVYLLHMSEYKVASNYTGSGYQYEITGDNLIWFRQIEGFTGYIDGNNKNLFIQGNNTSITSGKTSKYYVAENHDGLISHETPNEVSYYVLNENSKNFEEKTSKVKYLQDAVTNYTINSGTYYINFDLTYPERVEISGDVTLIFANGVTFNVEKGIHLTNGNTLTLAAQTTDKNQAGKLIAKGFDGKAAIGGNEGSSVDEGSDGENCGNFYDYSVKLEINSDSVGIGGGKAGIAQSGRYVGGRSGGNGGNVKICNAIATITSNGTGIGGGQAELKAGSAKSGNGGNGGTLDLINTDLNVNSYASYGIGGGRAWWSEEISFGGEDGFGTKLSVYGGTTKVRSGYGKAICAYKEGVENYGEQTIDFLDGNIMAKFGTDENHTNDFGLYKITDLASAKYVEIGNNDSKDNYASMISGGSFIIISVIAGVALVLAGVFMTLYFKGRKKTETEG